MSAEAVTHLPKFFILDHSGITEKHIEGTTATVTLTNEIGHEIFKKSFSQKESFNSFLESHIISFPGYSPALAMLIPPRTKSWEGLAQDVLFPTLVNHALNQQGIVQKVAGSVAGLALDLLTLIPRLVVTPFRMLYNADMERLDHPLAYLLKDDPEAMSSLKSGYLIAHSSINVVEIKESESNEENSVHFSASIKTVKVSQPIITNFNMPCPIQERVEIKIDYAYYKGEKRKSDGNAFISTYSSTSNTLIPTKFHFFSDFEKTGNQAHHIFVNHLMS